MLVQPVAAIGVALVLATAAGAQTVEFRVVQEALTGNASVVTAVMQGAPLNSANPRGNYAVQARVTAGPSGTALAQFSFDIVMPGESDSYGTLAKMRISSADGTFYTGSPAANAAVGTGGMARQYTYLAGIGSDFNGLINISGATYTNNPDQQEIGIITGAGAGSALLATPDLDPSGEGNPSTWSGYGQTPPGTPTVGTTVPLPAGLGPNYFAEGQFVDIYRFRYNASYFSERVMVFTLQNVTAVAFSQLVFNNGSWGPQGTNIPASSITVTPLLILNIPAPSTAGVLTTAVLVIGRRPGRRSAL